MPRPRRAAVLRADLMVVVAYGLILPQAVLDIPRLGCINSHASLLPRWRGAAPIQRAVEAGDAESGVTVMQMEAGLDTGPMLLKVSTPISAADTGGSLHDRLAALGGGRSHRRPAAGTLHGEIQDDALATYAHKLNKDEARLDWSRPAVELERQVRAFTPGRSATQPRRCAAESPRRQPGQGSGAPGTILEASRDGLLVACGEGALHPAAGKRQAWPSPTSTTAAASNSPPARCSANEPASRRLRQALAAVLADAPRCLARCRRNWTRSPRAIAA